MRLEPTIQIKKDEDIKIPSCNFNGRLISIDSTSIGGLKGWIYQIQGIENTYKMLLIERLLILGPRRPQKSGPGQISNIFLSI